MLDDVLLFIFLFLNIIFVYFSYFQITIVILIGLLLASISTFIFIGEQSAIFCSSSHLLFHFSCTLIYGPLVIKTGRIYRIFSASKKLKIAKRLVSLNSQMMLIAVIVIIQVKSTVV